MTSWSWQKSLLLLGFCALGAGSWEARAQDAGDEAIAESESGERGEPDRDDPRARLAWEAEMSGPITAAVRANEMKQVNLHNAKKNAPGAKWVNIGPVTADYEQNGSFTGHVRDSGRARNILFHPDYPDTVFFLTSGGGLWRTDNWSANSPTWTDEFCDDNAVEKHQKKKRKGKQSFHEGLNLILAQANSARQILPCARIHL